MLGSLLEELTPPSPSSECFNNQKLPWFLGITPTTESAVVFPCPSPHQEKMQTPPRTTEVCTFFPNPQSILPSGWNVSDVAFPTTLLGWELQEHSSGAGMVALGRLYP